MWSLRAPSSNIRFYNTVNFALMLCPADFVHFFAVGRGVHPWHIWFGNWTCLRQGRSPCGQAGRLFPVLANVEKSFFNWSRLLKRLNCFPVFPHSKYLYHVSSYAACYPERGSRRSKVSIGVNDVDKCSRFRTGSRNSQADRVYSLQFIEHQQARPHICHFFST